MKPVIEIQNLSHYYGKGALKKQILFDIDLSIYPGEIVLLTGPSGSGKTTLLSLIGGLRSVQEGSLCTVDVELNGANEEVLVEVRRHIGYIFQAHNLLPFMTACQNVQMSVELQKDVLSEEAQERSASALKSVGLGDHIQYYPDSLSGGQKQRVAIARALVNRPKLVLADEPTAALDSQTGREVVNLMQIMAREQKCTILLVTHDNRILDIADRIVHLEDGKLQQNNIVANTLVANTLVASTQPIAHDLPAAVELMPRTIEAEVVTDPWVVPGFAPSLHTPSLAEFQPDSQPDSQPLPVAAIEKLVPTQIYTVACIDDSPAILYALKDFLSNELFSVVLINDPIKALTELPKVKPNLIILDINMPKLDGYQLCEILRRHQYFKTIPIIFITGEPKLLKPEAAQALGVKDYLIKPFNQSDLIGKLFLALLHDYKNKQL